MQYSQAGGGARYNSSIQEAEAGGSLSLRPAWSIEEILGQPRTIQRNHVSKNKIKQQQKPHNTIYNIKYE